MVSLSTTESEYIAAASATQEAMWLIKILSDMEVKMALPVVIHEDNQGCIFLAKNPETRRTKHIDTKWHFIRDCIESKRIMLKYISTEHQEADVLTKPLARKTIRRSQKSDRVEARRSVRVMFTSCIILRDYQPIIE